jgi:hypothetical protein
MLNQTLELSIDDKLLGCFGFSNGIKFKLMNDSLSIGLLKLGTDNVNMNGCPRFPKKETILIFSEALEKAEVKRYKRF